MYEEQSPLGDLRATLDRLLADELDLDDPEEALGRIASVMESAVGGMCEEGDLTWAKQLANGVLRQAIAPHVVEVVWFALRALNACTRGELRKLQPGVNQRPNPRLWNLGRLQRSAKVALLFFGAKHERPRAIGDPAVAPWHSARPAA